MKISIFGGSSPREGSPEYLQAYAMGREFALAGYTILTGGYIGTMEAASRGAAEANGHVIGITCKQIEDWRPITANAWVKEEHNCPTLLERLKVLIESCDATIALPGGPGTLAEISLTWNLMIINAIPTKPLILIGKDWQQTITGFCDTFDPYIQDSQRKLIQFANDYQEAYRLIQDLLDPYN